VKHDYITFANMGEEGITPPYSQGSPSLETSLMIQLARKIAEETEKLDSYFKNNDLPDLGFDVNAPDDLPRLPEDIQKCRQEISSATKQLELLVRGPRETIRWGIWSVSVCLPGHFSRTNVQKYLDTLSLQILNSYKICEHAYSTIRLVADTQKTILSRWISPFL
jgi:hypothetical protein